MGDAVGVVAVPMSDTVKEVVDGRVRRIVPRETLVQVIGPWVFGRDALVEALARIEDPRGNIEDLLAFCEAARLQVRVLAAS